jgi:hypothetical protein
MSRPPHLFRGKKIEFAPTTGINGFRPVADDFVRKIFEFETGSRPGRNPQEEKAK